MFCGVLCNMVTWSLCNMVFIVFVKLDDVLCPFFLQYLLDAIDIIEIIFAYL